MGRCMVAIAAVIAAAALATECRAAVFEPGNVEVVVARDAPKTVRFAADELTNFLSRVLSCEIPVAAAKSPGKRWIFLGDSPEARKAGIDVAGMKRDAFAIVSDADGVVIAGRDDPSADTGAAVRSRKTGVWALYHEHATLFGVYEFLERFAGVRMYFPGELGEIAPKSHCVRVPAGRIDVAPDFTARDYSWSGDGAWFDGDDKCERLKPERKLNYVRNRMQTMYIPCCHGSRQFEIQRRFAAEHPEYMALFRKGGKLVRDVDPAETRHHPGQLCHSSAVYDELFEDIRSYANGESAQVRGIGNNWPIMAFRRPWVDIMPQDGYIECLCEKCQAAYDKSSGDYATRLVWGRTVELANRLRAAGAPVRITQMAYTPYRSVPDFDIPDNIDVMVAEPGPWSIENAGWTARELGEIRAWNAKLGRKVWIWTYPNKFGNRSVPDVPNGTPRAWAKYFKRAAPWIFGAYAECENDRFLYNSLCYHVFGKVCWNTGTDEEAVLDEYFRLMFGAAAKPMAGFFRDIEERWLRDVSCNMADTDEGPVRQMPSEYALYARIYSPKVMRAWQLMLAEAKSLVAGGSPEAKRIELFRREFYLPLARRVADYVRSTSVEAEVARRKTSQRPNLLANGDFSAPPSGGSKRHFGHYDDQARGRGWRGGWICRESDVPHVALVDGVPDGVTGRAARLSISGKAGTVRLENNAPGMRGMFKPGKRYRISYFTRLDGVESGGRGGGAGIRVWSDRNHWFPQNRMTGSTGWIHQEFFFTAGEKSAEHVSQFEICLRDASGSVDYAGLRVEEAE